MVSNLKSLAGAPCVRIPRQEKLRQNAKGTKKSQHLLLGGAGGLRSHLGASRGEAGGGKGAMKGQGGKARRLGGGGGGTKSIALRGEGEEEGGTRGERGDGWDVFGSVSWNGDASGEFDVLGVPLPGLIGSPSAGSAANATAVAPTSAAALYGGSWGAPRRGGRRLPAAQARQPAALTMSMSVECADWLKVKEHERIMR